MQFARNMFLKVLGAIATILMIHGFVVWLNLPGPQALVLGAVIYAALIAVLFSRWSFLEKIRIYLVFVVMFVVGGNTLCGCTDAELFAASIAGLLTFFAVGLFKDVPPNETPDPENAQKTDINP
jgi:hypothetical protein